MTRLLGRSGVHARSALLFASTVAAVFASVAVVAGLAFAALAALLLSAPRRALVLASATALACAVYAAVVALAGGPAVLGAVAGLRVSVPLGAALLVAAETPAAAWIALRPRGRGAAALASALAVLPALERDAEALRDAARMRGLGALRASLLVVPASFVRALRRGRLLDEALAQSGHPSPERVPYARRAWNAHDAAVLVVALLLGGAAFA